jgi:hypothetical protein
MIRIGPRTGMIGIRLSARGRLAWEVFVSMAPNDRWSYGLGAERDSMGLLPLRWGKLGG